jgi:gliding motility-associated-like protein
MTSEICILYTDIENNDHLFSSGTSTSAGLISDIASGDVCFNYTPPDGFIGQDIVEVIICDATDGTVCNSGTITVNVLDVNESPVFLINGIPSADAVIETPEDTPLNHCFEVIDPEGDIVVVNLINNQVGGGTLIADASADFCFDFDPTKDFNGESIWEIEICDDNADPLCNILTLTVDVVPVNDAPVLNGTFGTTDYPWESVVVNNTIDISDIDDTDIEGATVSIGENLVSGDDVLEFTNQNGISGNYSTNTGVLTLSGTATLSDYQTALSSIQYLNNGASELTRRIDYSVNDGELESNLQSQFMSIVIQNNAPIIDPNSLFELNEDSSQEFCITVNDADGDLVRITSIVEISSNGIISGNGDLCFQYTPEPNFFGEDTFTITVCDDGVPSLCDELTVSVTILPVNDAPFAARDVLRVRRNKEGQINVITNDSDLENDALTLMTNPEKSPMHGSAVLFSDGTISYTSDVTYRGLDSLVYGISDNGVPNMFASGVLVFEIEDEPFTAYQAVSPNSDGINDFWYIEGIDYYPDNQVRLYDRYNNLVFEQKGYNNSDKSWSGQSNKGDQLSDGTYFYFINLGRGDDKSSGSYQGFLVLKNN